MDGEQVTFFLFDPLASHLGEMAKFRREMAENLTAEEFSSCFVRQSDRGKVEPLMQVEAV